MKRTKQAAAVLTALALAASMALPVWAAETEGSTLISGDSSTISAGKTAAHDVTATYNPEKVYHLDIEWADMTFTYIPGTWNPEATNNAGNNTMGYQKSDGDDALEVGWNNKAGKDDHKITVTNKSNADISVKFSYESDADYKDRVAGNFHTVVKNGNNSHTDVDVEIGEEGIWLERADAAINNTVIGASATSVGKKQYTITEGTPSKADVYLVLVGRPKNAISNAKIGTATITLMPTDDTKTYSAYFPAEGDSYQK